MSGNSVRKLAAVLVGAVILFLVGCTPGSSDSSNDPPASPTAGSGGTAAVAGPVNDPPSRTTALATDPVNDPPSDPIASSGGNPIVADPVNDPPLDPIVSFGSGSLGGDPGNDPVGDGPSTSCPEPATGLLFLCAAGSAALGRLRARKRA
jgi:hypothetical protein